MERRTVVIVGDSLFAESLSQMLQSDQVRVAGCAPTPNAAMALIAAHQPDAVIVAETDRAGTADYSQLLKNDLDLPIIRANLNADSVQVITSHRIGTRPADLLTALAELPKRS
jgi:AmiR/NasT family two-component response regulator